MTSPRVARAVVVAWLALALVGAAGAGPVTDQLKTEIDRVIAVLDDPALKGPAKSQERRQAIRTITDEVFDWTEMARRALGRHWPEISAAEQGEFVPLFRDLIERTYISKLEQYSGEKLQYAGELMDGTQATVRTKVLLKNGNEAPIDYRLSREGDRWRVYDVLIENVSLVGNYRTQFDGIIRSSSYDELVKRIRARSS